jgi:hypothetical protein
MDVRELRNGNLIQGIETGNPVVFVSLDIEAPDARCYVNRNINAPNASFIWDRGWSLSDVCGIPITVEWLKKFKFSCPKDSWYCSKDYSKERDTFKICFHDESGSWFLVGRGESIGFKYLHQLQNLFYDLTGKDLASKKQ